MKNIDRCEKTGSPCGTDTWAEGYFCPCAPCQRYMAIELPHWPLCEVCGETALGGNHATDFGEGHDYVPTEVAK